VSSIAEPAGSGSAKGEPQAGLAAAVLLALRCGGADRGSCGHHLPLGLHIWIACTNGRSARPLTFVGCRITRPAACALRLLGVAPLVYTRLFPVAKKAKIKKTASVRHAGGCGVSRQIPDARFLVARPVLLPMMATPVAIALVWTMIFHKQLALTYLLCRSSACRRSFWVFQSATVIRRW